MVFITNPVISTVFLVDMPVDILNLVANGDGC